MTDDLQEPDMSAVALATEDELILEGQIARPARATGAAILAHPHPLHGGNMQSLVTSELFQRLPEAGILTLRFNFRGVDGSEGEHGDGIAETFDIEAALTALDAEAFDGPVITAGWSFGADVSLRVVDDRIAGWFCAAPPLRDTDSMVAAANSRPKLLEIPEHDQFNPPPAATEITANWANTTVETVAGADHFLVGRTNRVAEACLRFMSTLG